MELEQDGNLIHIELGLPTVVGREIGLRVGSSSSDNTISRRHVSLQFLDTRTDMVDNEDLGRELLLSFEVIGKNPILVISKEGKIRSVYKKSEKGVLRAGDSISLSIKNPSYFFVKRREKRKEEVETGVFDAVERRERRTRQRRKEVEEREKLEEAGEEDDEGVWEGAGLEISSFDISVVDPVKEFGFLVRGHEFDHYPRRKLHPLKDWNWFLEDTRGESSENNEMDEVVGIQLNNKSKRKKNKKGRNVDDEDWTKEIEDENILTAKASSSKQIRISTRSKVSTKPHNNNRDNKSAAEKEFNSREIEVDNEEDETLGGFIVVDDDIEEEEEEVLEEESEEEEDEDDDELTS